MKPLPKPVAAFASLTLVLLAGAASASQDAAAPHARSASDALMARVHAGACAARAASAPDAGKRTGKTRHAPDEDDPCQDSRGVGAPAAATRPAAN